MKIIWLALLLIFSVSCFKGPDPIKDYAQFSEYVEYAPDQIVEHDIPENDYYLSDDALVLTAPEKVVAKDDLSIAFFAKLTGALAEEVDWDLKIKNPLIGITIKQVSKNTWNVSGKLNAEELDALFTNSYQLKLDLVAKGALTEEQDARANYYAEPTVKVEFK